MPIEAPAPAPEQEGPYLPAGPERGIVFEDFEGMNTQPNRAGVDDKQAAWLDGWMPVAKRNLRTMPDVGPALVTFGSEIVFMSFQTLVNAPFPFFGVFVLADGSIQVVNTQAPFTVIQIAAPGTIVPGQSSDQIGMVTSNGYLVIVSNQLNGYFLWDGTFFFPAGAFVPALAGNVPTGIFGSAIEIYSGHVWIAAGPSIFFSAPGSLIDFTTANGGGSFTSSDSFLRTTFERLIQTNGLLYLIADSSMNYISNVQSSGVGPVTTTFTNQNADPENGTIWPNSVQVWGRNIIFANSIGVQISYGSAVTKISSPLDGVYFGTSAFVPSPSSAKAVIFGKKVFILLKPTIDPVTGGDFVNKMFLWDGKLWWASSQSVDLEFIATQEIQSELTAWGHNGFTVYPLFSDPGTFRKVAQSKFWDNPGYQFQKALTRFWAILDYNTDDPAPVIFSLDSETVTDAQQVQFSTMNTGFQILPPTAVSENGVLLGFTIETGSKDLTLVSCMSDTKITQYRG